MIQNIVGGLFNKVIDNAEGILDKVITTDKERDAAKLALKKLMLEAEKDTSRRQAFSELLDYSQSGRLPSVRLPIRGFRIGDFCVLGLAHEIFAEYHHYINKISTFPSNMVFAYTNGVECYVGTKTDYDLGTNGGYETSPMGAALLYRPRLPLSQKSEVLIKNGLK